MSWLPTVTTVAAADEPVTLAQAKAQCHVVSADTSFDDALNGHIATARNQVESITGTRLQEQTIEMRCTSFSDLDHLPVGPLISVESITYIDTSGSVQMLSESVYEARLYNLSPQIVLKYGQVWPTIREGSPITVTADAGYDTVPPALVSAMLLIIGDLFTFHETVSVGTSSMLQTSTMIDNLIANHRIYAP